jgi:Protein of unknown function (DUF3551)
LPAGWRTKAIRRGYAGTGGAPTSREVPVRTIFLIALVGTALSYAGTEARAAPWCANYSPDNGTNCGFYTIEQCRAAISGVGGHCTPNPFEAGTDLRRRNRRD